MFVDKSHLARVIPLDVSVLRKELQNDNEVMLEYWRTLAPILIFSDHFQTDTYPFFLANMTFKKLKQWINDENKAKIKILDEGDEIVLPAGGILWQGELTEKIRDEDLRGNQIKKLKQSASEEYGSHFQSTAGDLDGINPHVGPLDVDKDPSKL
jgi:hypothetical protein